MTIKSSTKSARAIEQTTWRIDPGRSSVRFEAPSFWGLFKVKGRFARYEGTLDLRRTPAVELTIDAGSIDTGNARRDKHLRSDDFLGEERHPQVVFVADTATQDGDKLIIEGELRAGGGSMPLELVATLRRAGLELEIEAAAALDQRRLGMSFNLLGMVGSPTRVAVRGRLVEVEDTDV